MSYLLVTRKIKASVAEKSFKNNKINTIKQIKLFNTQLSNLTYAFKTSFLIDITYVFSKNLTGLRVELLQLVYVMECQTISFYKNLVV